MAAHGGRTDILGATHGGWYKGSDADKMRQLCGQLGLYFAGASADVVCSDLCSVGRGMHGAGRWTAGHFSSNSRSLTVDINRRQIAVTLGYLVPAADVRSALTSVRRSIVAGL